MTRVISSKELFYQFIWWNSFPWTCNLTFLLSLKVRLGWHDAGTYNKNIEEWPQRGGANGSLRFDVELGHGANAGNSSTITVHYRLLVFILIDWFYRSCQCLETH